MLRLLRQSQPTLIRRARSHLFAASQSFDTLPNNRNLTTVGSLLVTLNNSSQIYHHHSPHTTISTTNRHSSTLMAAAATAISPYWGYPSVPAAAASTNSLARGDQPSSLSSFHYQTKRFYFYIPTSWIELKLRMRDNGETKTRKVIVKLHQFWNKHYIRSAEKKAKIKASVAANRKQGREWLEKQQQQFLVLRNNFKGRRRRFYRKRFKEPLLRLVRPGSSSSSCSNASSDSRHIDLALVHRHRGQWVVSSSSSPISLPESISSDSLSMTEAPPQHRFVVKVREYSEASWFDAASGRPLVSRDETGRFVNPWLSQSSDGVHPISSIIKWRRIRLAREWSAFWQNNNLMLQHWIRPILNYYDYFINSMYASSSTLSVTTSPTQQADQPVHATIPKSDAPQQAKQQLQQQQLAEGTLRFTWIGHATCLLQQGDISILTDPIFSAHASPLPPLLAPFMGVARHVPPLRVSSSHQRHLHHDDDENDSNDGKAVILPDKIDVCLISHDHYDHLDLPSVQQLSDLVSCWVVPIGIGEFLQRHASIPAHRIVELEWWESAKLVRKPTFMDMKNGDKNNEDPDDSDSKCEHEHDWRCVQIHSLHKRNHDNGEQEQASPPSHSMTTSHHHPARLDPATTNQLWITATPVQHWASRTMLDRNYRLWAGFCVFMDQQQTFFFAGDTAFPQEFPLFEQVADYIASAKINSNNHSNNGGDAYDDDQDDENTTIVDLAALPIGAYKPRFLNHTSHMEPKDALRVHEILQCRQSVAIHYGTFCLSEEPPDEPPRLLREAIAEKAASVMMEQQQQGVKDGNVNHAATAAASLNFVAIPHGGCVTLEPVSATPSTTVVDDGRNVVKGDNNSDKNGEENDDDDDSNNHASALG